MIGRGGWRNLFREGPKRNRKWREWSVGLLIAAIALTAIMSTYFIIAANVGGIDYDECAYGWCCPDKDNYYILQIPNNKRLYDDGPKGQSDFCVRVADGFIFPAQHQNEVVDDLGELIWETVTTNSSSPPSGPQN